jgi:hypothetical protein
MKIGATLAAGPPAVLPVIDGVGVWLQQYATPSDAPDLSTQLKLTAATWIDSLAQGYGFNKPFSTIQGTTISGAARGYTTQVTPPKGVFMITTAIGVGTMVASAVQSRLVRFVGGVKQVRIFNRRVA